MLVLLKNIRKKLLVLWAGFSIPVLLLVFTQTIMGKFGEIVGEIWIWVAVNLLPVLALLFIGVIQNKHGDKVIQRFVFRIILGFSILYLILLLMTQLGLSARSVEQSIHSYFMQSYKWLVPFQLLLISVFTLLFYRKQTVFQPSEQIIKNHFKEKAKSADSQNNAFQKEAFDKLIDRNFVGLFEQIKLHTKETIDDSDKFNETILLQGQYNQWKKDTDMNLIDTKDAQITINRISMALVNLIDEL